MKKLLSLVAVAGMALGTASVASAATNVKIKGQFDIAFGLYQGTSFMKHDGQENFDTVERFRTQVDFIASEYLKGVAYFEVGDMHWGAGGGATYGWGPSGARGAGGAMGADGVNIEVKNLYIDWLAPETALQIRMGIQGFALPKAVSRADGNDGSAILDDDLAGILLSYNFTDEVGATLGWFRPWNPFVYGEAIQTQPITQHDAVDAFTLTLPIDFKEQFAFTPWFMYASVGQVDNTYDYDTGTPQDPGYISNWLTSHNALGANGNAWWSGFAFNLNYFDPFVAAVDFMYGSYSADDVTGQNPDRSGWAVVAKFGYKLDYFTPAIFGWYGSGSDDFWEDGQDGIMPYLSPDWGLTSFGWTNNHYYAREYLVATTPAGTWAVGIALEDIKLVDCITSQLRVAYFEGTNSIDKSKTPVGENAFFDYGVLGTKDHGFEVNFDNVYKIYDNLDLFVELGYVNLNLHNEPDNFENSAWKGYVGFTYSF